MYHVLVVVTCVYLFVCVFHVFALVKLVFLFVHVYAPCLVYALDRGLGGWTGRGEGLKEK